MSSEPAARVDYYDATTFWNSLEPVVGHMARRVSGTPDEWWPAYFKRLYCPVPRRRGLVIGCGNGWVERELIDLGVVSKVDAFDIDPANIAAAEAARGERAITYEVRSFEQFAARPDTYDLIINVAALHHAKHLYATTQRLAESLCADGVFLNWEYIGPSRNQYTRRQVAAMELMRESLPRRFRSPYALRHDVLMMTSADPTEAVHSAEIPRALRLYFDVAERRDVGGAIAYQLLWNNTAEFAADDPEARRWLAHLMAGDEQAIATVGLGTFFAFIVARRPATAPAAIRLRRAIQRWWWRSVIEPIRERLARRVGGLYPVELALLIRDRRAWRPRVAARAARWLVRLVRPH